jgi:hypothetical protein
MKDDVHNMMRILNILSKIEEQFLSGVSIKDCCSAQSITENELTKWCNQYAVPPQMGDLLSGSTLLDAVFPVFREETTGGMLQQIGSGVIVKIGIDLFALTAAHVADHSQSSVLFMPSNEGIIPISGGLSCNAEANRPSDNADMAYYHLGHEWHHKLPSTIRPLGIDDLLVSDQFETGNLFTFVGFPWRKTKSRPGVQETERVTYTGHALPPDIYTKLCYGRSTHILIRLRRKKTFSHRYQSYQTAPHPAGISGGAAIAWPQIYQDRCKSPNLKLAGIGHTYHSDHHCMAATRVIPYLIAIVRNNPHLAVHFSSEIHIEPSFGKFLADRMASLNPNNVPSCVGISWYRRDTYQRCLNVFHDADSLPASFDDWLRRAEEVERQILGKGMKCLRVEIDLDLFLAWCLEQKFAKVDVHARTAFCNLVVMNKYRK